MAEAALCVRWSAESWWRTGALHAGLVQDLVQQPAILALLVILLGEDEGADLDQEAVQLRLRSSWRAQWRYPD